MPQEACPSDGEVHMKKGLLIAAVAVLMVVGLAPPGSAHPHHRLASPGSIDLQKRWVGWALGSDAAPFLSRRCGEKNGRLFFMTAAIDTGLERNCIIRAGLPLVVSPAGTGVWAPTFGTTRKQLLDARDADLALVEDPKVTLDGKRLSLKGSFRNTGVYRIRVEDGSFIKTVDPGYPPNREFTRIASGGWLLVIHPLRLGHHVLTLFDEYNETPFDITFHIKIVRHYK
jgi:hypothetical protein